MKHRLIPGLLAATVLVSLGCAAPGTSPSAPTAQAVSADAGAATKRTYKKSFEVFAAEEADARRRRNATVVSEVVAHPVSVVENGATRYFVAVLNALGIDFFPTSYFSFTTPETAPPADAYKIQAADAKLPMLDLQRETPAQKLFAAQHPGRHGSPYRIQAVAEPHVLGDQLPFWVYDVESWFGGYNEVTAELVAVGDHCYVFAETSTLADPERAARVKLNAERMKQTFDATIFPSNTKHFGALVDPSEDVDGQERVYFLATDDLDGSGVIGYFLYNDQINPDQLGDDVEPPPDAAFSNRKDLLVLTSELFTADSSENDASLAGLVAHEYTHLQNFHQKYRKGRVPAVQETWIDESLAELATDLCGYGLASGNQVAAGQVASFLAGPQNISFVGFGSAPAYGAGRLFMTYLTERFGMGVVRELVVSRGVGTDHFDRLMARYHTSYRQVFYDFMVTLLADGRTTDPRYQLQAYAMGGRGEGFPLPDVATFLPQDLVNPDDPNPVFAGSGWFVELGTGTSWPTFSVAKYDAPGYLQQHFPMLLAPKLDLK